MLDYRLRPLVRHVFVTAIALMACIGVLVILPNLLPAAEPMPVEQLSIMTDLGTTTFQIEVAATDETREQGLMYRASMPRDHGMLFDFAVTQPVYFWMKNTYIPLDMIFIRADGTVASIARDTTPLSETVVPSGAPVRFVLEVNAGVAAKLGLKAGDHVVNRLMKKAS